VLGRCIEYLADAPCNRLDYAADPLYRGVGEGLKYLAILQSYEWGLRGRISLYSLPKALAFYENLNFVETGDRVDRIV